MLAIGKEKLVKTSDKKCLEEKEHITATHGDANSMTCSSEAVSYKTKFRQVHTSET